MLDRLTGRILHIDFGDCFEVAMTRDKFPEKIPFRLTRMLTNAMEVQLQHQLSKLWLSEVWLLISNLDCLKTRFSERFCLALATCSMDNRRCTILCATTVDVHVNRVFQDAIPYLCCDQLLVWFNPWRGGGVDEDGVSIPYCRELVLLSWIPLRYADTCTV